MTSPNDVIAQLEEGLSELYNQLMSSIDPSTPERLAGWLKLDADRAAALIPLAREAASLIKTLTQAVETEREECAKCCEGDFDSEMQGYGDYFASAIRARSTQDKT